MKKILILGAGIYQVPLINKCREMGHFVIVSSIPGNYPGFACADKVYYENTVDKDAILKIAKDEEIDAILTTGTDVAVSTIGYVNDKLGLCGVTFESAEWVTNKLHMKEQLQNQGVRTAKFHKAYNVDDALKACDDIGFPVVFKCVDMSGSRGIMRIDSPEEAEKAFQYSMSATRCDYILVEKFLEGHEIGVDGYIGENGSFIVPHDKLICGNGATNVPVGHIFPYCGSDQLTNDITEQINSAAKALKLQKVFFNSDVMICGNEAYIIEISARCGATCIPELISIHYGVDYYGSMVINALGENVSFPDKPICAAIGELLRSDKSGIITSISYNEAIQYADQISFDYQIGDSVNAFRVGPDRIGQVIVHGDDLQKANMNLENAKKHICVDIRSEQET